MFLPSYLFPPVCFGCGTRQTPDFSGVLCPTCLAKWEREQAATCRRCGRRFTHCVCQQQDNVLARPYPIFSVAPYRRKSVAEQLVRAAKRSASLPLFRFLADALATRLLAANVSVGKQTVIAYLPRSAKNRRREGQDQGALLAQALGARLGCPVIACFDNRSRISQKKLGREARFAHAARALVARENILAVRGKHVILVDDVATSGAGFAVGYALLRQAGAARVVCASIAKAGA